MARTQAETKQVDPDVLKRSVTAGDLPDSPNAGVFHLYLPLMAGSAAYDLPPYWSPGRDWQLYQTIYRESQWANAVTKAITKLSSRSFEVESEVPARMKRALDLLKHFDASRGWVPGIAKHLQAFLLTGNGAFLEIVRTTKAAGSRIIGLVHLDTFRCIRTGDPEYPVIFRDRRGVEHVLRAHQVLMLSDQPDQAELWNGVGHCAAERAYRTLCRLESIERYVFDKVSGQRPLAVHVISGINTKQLNEAITKAKEDAAAKGMVQFMGAVMMGSVTPETPGVATIPLAELPDGFDAALERKNAYLTYANALGIDPQILDPDLIASRALGTGAQSRLIAEKAEVIGLAAWTKAFEHAINEYVLDEKTTFTFSESDLTEEERKAAITVNRATAVSTLATGYIITPRQGLQMLADWGEVPEEFLPADDETPEGSITDEEKPQADEEPVSTETPSPIDEILTQEARREMHGMLAETLARARRQGQKEAEQSLALEAVRKALQALAEAETVPPAPIVVQAPDVHMHVDNSGIHSEIQALAHATAKALEPSPPIDMRPVALAIREAAEIAARPQAPVPVQLTMTMPVDDRPEVTEILERDGSGRVKKARKTRQEKP